MFTCSAFHITSQSTALGLPAQRGGLDDHTGDDRAAPIFGQQPPAQIEAINSAGRVNFKRICSVNDPLNSLHVHRVRA